MAKFSKKTWYNTGDTEATDSNSILNKTTMNDLENRIDNATNSITQELNTNVSNLVSKSDFNSAISNLVNKNGNGLSLKYQNANVLPEYFKQGTCQYIKLGNLVIVLLQDLQAAKQIDENHLPIITGVPKPISIIYFFIYSAQGTYYRLRITTQGNIETQYCHLPEGAAGNEIFGYAIYLTSK